MKCNAKNPPNNQFGLAYVIRHKSMSVMYDMYILQLVSKENFSFIIRQDISTYYFPTFCSFILHSGILKLQSCMVW